MVISLFEKMNKTRLSNILATLVDKVLELANAKSLRPLVLPCILSFVEKNPWKTRQILKEIYKTLKSYFES